MRRKHKKDVRRRKREMAEYHKMIRRIEKGEVSRLLWTAAGKSFPVIVQAAAIYLVEKTPQGAEHRRHLAPGVLARHYEVPTDEHWAKD